MCLKPKNKFKLEVNKNIGDKNCIKLLIINNHNDNKANKLRKTRV